MHDVVAHSLGVIVAQADGGRYAAAGDPDAATRALAAIGDLGRRSLGEMRELLAVLRDDDARGVAPAPGLGDLDDLVEDYRRAGLRVRLTEHGERPEASPTLALTGYRVVQEALANTLRHRGPGPVTVDLDWSGDPWILTVTDVDTGTGPPASPVPAVTTGERTGTKPAAAGPGSASTGTGLNAGHGLMGMRERVAVHGGHLEAGPTETGWRVRASLPRRQKGEQ